MSSSTLTAASGAADRPRGHGGGAVGAPPPLLAARAAAELNEISLEDARSADPAERLLEESWPARAGASGRRETIVESLAALLFLAAALPLAALTLGAHPLDLPLAAELVVLYALASRGVKFPLGAGYVVPSYLVLVPMLVLLSPGDVPLLTAGGLVLGTGAQVLRGHARPSQVLFSIADAWHSLAPALVLGALAGRSSGVTLTALYAAAFAAACALDLLSGTLRERAIGAVAGRVQLRVQAQVWTVDACLAPLGLLLADAMRRDRAQVLLALPLGILLVLLGRERDGRIAQAARRLELLAHERERLQRAVRRLGDALAAKLDLAALAEIVLRGSIEALDCAAGRLVMEGTTAHHELEVAGSGQHGNALRAASEQVLAGGEWCQLERDGGWALAVPLGFDGEAGQARGAIAVARPRRRFRGDERSLLEGLAERAGAAAQDIVAHGLLREQALTDPLTGLGNRRRLAAELGELTAGQSERPLVLVLFDLDGFKGYNDTFGHQAGDALLSRMGRRLAGTALELEGAAYRLGGDEFCVVVPDPAGGAEEAAARCAETMTERGENFTVGASFGVVAIPAEADGLDYALQLADERMYARKRGRAATAGDQAREVLISIIRTRQPALHEHCSGVAQLAQRVGRALGIAAEELDELVRAAEVHDIGKVAIPEDILASAGELEPQELQFARQHAVIGERILGAAPALRPIARIVRATHERWDGKGYPDGLRGCEIPLAARVIAACDAYEAIAEGRLARPSRGPEQALAELRRGAGSQFDPDVVAAIEGELRSAPAPAPLADLGAHA